MEGKRGGRWLCEKWWWSRLREDGAAKVGREAAGERNSNVKGRVKELR